MVLGVGIEYIMWMTFQITGIIVWSILFLVIAYLVLVELLLIGCYASFSYHRWVLRTDRHAGITPLFIWSFITHIFKFFGLRTTTRTEYRSINGGHWRSAYDYSYNWSDRMARMARDVADKPTDKVALEGATP